MREKAIAPKTSKEIKKAFDIDEKKCSNLFRQREKYSQLLLFSSFTKFQKNIKDKITCFNSPVLNGRLQFWEDSSPPPCLSWNLSFYDEMIDDPGWNVRYLWIFQVDHIFYKLDVKILTNNNKIRCVSSYPPSSSSTSDPFQQKLYCFGI